jgi:outer membrane protein assembly factor BamB
MRIVEYQKETTSIRYRVIKTLGIIAGIFSLVVCLLMIANHLSLKRNDPIHSPALLQLMDELKANPQNEPLKEQIRELDYLARRAFFSSQHFNYLGIFLLLGGLVVMVVSFKTMEAYRARFPYPNSRDPKDDLIADAKWARQTVTVVGLVLAGFALVLAIPWKSPLNELEKTSAASVPGATTGTPAHPDATAPTIPSVPVAVATREERLKNWPAFLGPAAGHVASAELPTKWDAESGEGIVWKTEIPKPGFSSPIIWNQRVFLSGGDQETREILAFDFETGALLWRHEVRDIPGSPAQPPKVANDTGFAAPTMATDGTRVFAIFATGDVVALDFEGNRVWGRNLGVPHNPYGHGSSLVIFEDLLLVQFDHEDSGTLFGLEVATGAPRWQTPRSFGPSWSSPLLIETDGKPQVILAAAPTVVSYDPRTGAELWRVDCLKRGEVAPTPVFANGLLYVAADYVGLFAIDINTQAIVWKVEELMPGVCTPIVAGEFLIYGLNDGGIICRNATTGEELWYEETDDGFYASPVLAGNRVYLMDRAGVMHIFAPGPTFESLAQPALGEESVCTPAMIGNSIIYRGTKHLFRL